GMEAICQTRVDDGAFEKPLHWRGRADRICARRGPSADRRGRRRGRRCRRRSRTGCRLTQWLLLRTRRGPARGANDRVCNVVQVGRGWLRRFSSAAGGPRRRITLAERLLARRTTAEYHVARKQTF